MSKAAVFDTPEIGFLCATDFRGGYEAEVLVPDPNMGRSSPPRQFVFPLVRIRVTAEQISVFDGPIREVFFSQWQTVTDIRHKQAEGANTQTTLMIFDEVKGLLIIRNRDPAAITALLKAVHLCASAPDRDLNARQALGLPTFENMSTSSQNQQQAAVSLGGGPNNSAAGNGGSNMYAHHTPHASQAYGSSSPPRAGGSQQLHGGHGESGGGGGNPPQQYDLEQQLELDRLRARTESMRRDISVSGLRSRTQDPARGSTARSESRTGSLAAPVGGTPGSRSESQHNKPGYLQDTDSARRRSAAAARRSTSIPRSDVSHQHGGGGSAATPYRQSSPNHHNNLSSAASPSALPPQYRQASPAPHLGGNGRTPSHQQQQQHYSSSQQQQRRSTSPMSEALASYDDKLRRSEALAAKIQAEFQQDRLALRAATAADFQSSSSSSLPTAQQSQTDVIVDELRLWMSTLEHAADESRRSLERRGVQVRQASSEPAPLAAVTVEQQQQQQQAMAPPMTANSAASVSAPPHQQQAAIIAQQQQQQQNVAATAAAGRPPVAPSAVVSATASANNNSSSNDTSSPTKPTTSAPTALVSSMDLQSPTNLEGTQKLSTVAAGGEQKEEALPPPQSRPSTAVPSDAAGAAVSQDGSEQVVPKPLDLGGARPPTFDMKVSSPLIDAQMASPLSTMSPESSSPAVRFDHDAGASVASSHLQTPQASPITTTTATAATQQQQQNNSSSSKLEEQKQQQPEGDNKTTSASEPPEKKVDPSLPPPPARLPPPPLGKKVAPPPPSVAPKLPSSASAVAEKKEGEAATAAAAATPAPATASTTASQETQQQQQQAAAAAAATAPAAPQPAFKMPVHELDMSMMNVPPTVKEGWKRFYEKKSNRFCYENIATRDRQYSREGTSFAKTPEPPLPELPAANKNKKAGGGEDDDPTKVIVKDGWQRMWAAAKGKHYYVNLETKAKTWKAEETPFASSSSSTSGAGAGAAVSSPTASASPLTAATNEDMTATVTKGNWKRIWVPEKNKPYYVNLETKEKTWKAAETSFADGGGGGGGGASASAASPTTPMPPLSPASPTSAPATTSAPASAAAAASNKDAEDLTVPVTKGEWKRVWSAEKNKCYYVNIETKKTTWKVDGTSFVDGSAGAVPASPAGSPKAAVASPPASPSGGGGGGGGDPTSPQVKGEWKRLWSAEKNKHYYVNLETKKTQWKVDGTSFEGEASPSSASPPASPPGSPAGSPTAAGGGGGGGDDDPTSPVVKGSWKRVWAAEKGKHYYVNLETKERTWKAAGTSFA